MYLNKNEKNKTHEQTGHVVRGFIRVSSQELPLRGGGEYHQRRHLGLAGPDPPLRGASVESAAVSVGRKRRCGLDMFAFFRPWVKRGRIVGPEKHQRRYGQGCCCMFPFGWFEISPFWPMKGEFSPTCLCHGEKNKKTVKTSTRCWCAT